MSLEQLLAWIPPGSPDEALARQVNFEQLPAHVAVIMDGNGRWASARGLERLHGHSRGARRVTEIVRACPDLGISHLTLYAFSTENWQRPLAEVDGVTTLTVVVLHTTRANRDAQLASGMERGLQHGLDRFERLITPASPPPTNAEERP